MGHDNSELPPDRLWQPTTAKWFFVVFGFSLAYAVVRYHLAGDVPWRHFPLFILLSPAVTTLPMMPKAIGGVRWKRSQHAGYTALVLVVVHLVAMGYKGRLAPQGWQGGIPPVSLVAVVAALVPLLVKRKRMQDEHERAEARKHSEAK